MIYRSFDNGCSGGFRGLNDGFSNSFGRCNHHCSCHRPHCCMPFCFPHHCPPEHMPGMPPITSPVSVLTAVNTADTTVTAGGTLPFAFNSVAYSSDITHASGATVVTINTPGVYMVHFTGVATPLEDAEAGDTVRVELQVNGAAVPGAASANTFASATASMPFAFTTAIAVTTVPANLSVVLPEEGAIFTDAAFTVQRIGSIPTTTTTPSC